MITPQDRQSFGESGYLNEIGTTAITGKNLCALQCLTDTVFSALLDNLATGDSLAGVTLPAGTVLVGSFSGFTLTSGAVRAYNAATRA